VGTATPNQPPATINPRRIAPVSTSRGKVHSPTSERFQGEELLTGSLDVGVGECGSWKWPTALLVSTTAEN
jgi:hypothetical protein